MPRYATNKTKEKAVKTIKLLNNPRSLKYVVEKVYGPPYTGEKASRFKRDVYPHIEKVMFIGKNIVPNLSGKGQKILAHNKKVMEQIEQTDNRSLLAETKELKLSLYQKYNKKFKESRGKVIFIDLDKLVRIWKTEQIRIIKSTKDDPTKIYMRCEKHITKLSRNTQFKILLKHYLIDSINDPASIERLLGEDFAISLVVNKETLLAAILGIGNYPEYKKHLEILMCYARFLETNRIHTQLNIFRALEKAFRSQVHYSPEMDLKNTIRLFQKNYS